MSEETKEWSLSDDNTLISATRTEVEAWLKIQEQKQCLPEFIQTSDGSIRFETTEHRDTFEETSPAQ